jgi:hypothetical protein
LPPEPSRTRRFAAGEGIAWTRPGDFILVRGTSWRSRLIRLFERLHFRRPGELHCSYWSHAALVVGTNGTIVEAGTAGVVVQHIEKYRDVDYHYVTVQATPDERRRAVRFASACIGSPYSRLALVSFAVSALTLGRVRFRDPKYDMCGSLVAKALGCAGETFDLPPADILPADLATHYGLGASATYASPRTANRRRRGAGARA